MAAQLFVQAGRHRMAQAVFAHLDRPQHLRSDPRRQRTAGDFDLGQLRHVGSVLLMSIHPPAAVFPHASLPVPARPSDRLGTCRRRHRRRLDCRRRPRACRRSGPAGSGWQRLTAVRTGNYDYLPKDLFQFKPNARWDQAYAYLLKLLYPGEA
ncbi:hypothetical protein SDC9_201400 [bioreactor metagenome]|uniref:Uncharacterized protein n=1 Tax=bioreactor metagenome TaxID=1076179 RepID=A0A645IZR6_9ZZZZ